MGRIGAWLRRFELRRTNEAIDGSARIAPRVQVSGSVLGRGARLADRCDVRASVVGDYSSIGRSTKIVNARIGRFCAISWDVTINAVGHPTDHATVSAFPYARRLGFVAHDMRREPVWVEIGHDVWIGAHAVLVPGVSIGTGAIVGAGAVVTKDVEPYTIVAGVPARVLRARFAPDVVEILMDSRWWMAPDHVLRAHVALFQQPVTRELAEQIRDACR
jgi:acetyltransferase-like isoleucine patch superfamily enzyme